MKIGPNLKQLSIFNLYHPRGLFSSRQIDYIFLIFLRKQGLTLEKYSKMSSTEIIIRHAKH